LRIIKPIKTNIMKTEITITNTINGEVTKFSNFDEAKSFIESEIKWFNSPNENKNGNGYDDSDFIISQD